MKTNTSRSKNLRLHSYPNHCEVCQLSSNEVELHPYTHLKKRLFCYWCWHVADTIRQMGYHEGNSYMPTTALTRKHLRLIKWLVRYLSASVSVPSRTEVYREIARVVILAEYGKTRHA